MHIIGNFYLLLAFILFMLIILAEPTYSLVKKFWIIVIVGAVILWMDKPVWLTQIVTNIRSRI